MTGGNIVIVGVSIVTTLAAVATIMTWLGFPVNGRKHAARVGAWLMRSRKEREALEHRISELEEQLSTVIVVMSKESDLQDATSQMTKRLDARIDSHAEKLNEIREQLAELRQHDNDLLAGSAVQYDAMDRRLRKLEGSPPAGYQGKVLPPIIFEPDDSTH